MRTLNVAELFTIACLLILLIAAFYSIHLFATRDAIRDHFIPSHLKDDQAGQVGDLIGGYLGTVFTLVSVVLLYLALRAQRIAAAEQSFETKYFELLTTHRENVLGLNFGGIEGRKVFPLIILEYRAVQAIVDEYLNISIYSNLDRMRIAYYCIYYGIGSNSNRMLRKVLRVFIENSADGLISQLQKYKSGALSLDGIDNLSFELRLHGHQHHLGHYYRHLFQSVMYVDRQRIRIDKYDFVKTLRAQLSSHEQALLLLNSLTLLGREWWSHRLIQKYRMVKNIPAGFFDETFELSLLALFKKMPHYFEFQEARADLEKAVDLDC